MVTYNRKFSARPVVELLDDGDVVSQGYTNMILNSIYQHGQSSDLYVVCGEADRSWHEMVGLGVKSASGKTLLFATKNVGAENESVPGGYYHFNEAQVICPNTWGNAFRLPTIEELKALGSYDSSSNWGKTVSGYDVYKISTATLKGRILPCPMGIMLMRQQGRSRATV